MKLSEVTMRQSEKRPCQPSTPAGAERRRRDGSLADPVAILAAEDEAALQHVEKFASAAKIILQRGFSAEAFEVVSDEIHYIHTSLRSHCTKEARYLLPLLLLHAESLQDTDEWSWHDIWEKVDDLRLRVEDLEDGYIHASLVHEMAEGCRQVAELIRDQILRERQEVLPIVKELLTPKEYRQLKKNVAQEESH